MKEEQHKIDKILKQGFKETRLDSPSADFASNLMSKIKTIDAKQSFRYSSLIPNPVKLGLGFIFTCVLVYFSMGTKSAPSSLINTYISIPDLSFSVPEIQFNTEFSNVVIYGLVFFMFLFSIQIYVIKTKVDRLKL